MKTSESIGKIAPALVKAQAACAVVVKDKTAKITGPKGTYEYNYSDFASVVEAIKPALRENGLAMVQAGQRETDGVTVITRVLHESGEWMETDTFIPCAIVSAQAIGSALTYGKRYGAQSFMLLPSADDDGKEATDHAPEPRSNTARQVAVDEFDKLSPEQQAAARKIANSIIDLCQNEPERMIPYKEDHIAKGDTETELAVWSILPSHVRAEYKRQQSKAALAAMGPKLVGNAK